MNNNGNGLKRKKPFYGLGVLRRSDGTVVRLDLRTITPLPQPRKA
jgi:hypothetical protein